MDIDSCKYVEEWSSSTITDMYLMKMIVTQYPIVDAHRTGSVLVDQLPLIRPVKEVRYCAHHHH